MAKLRRKLTDPFCAACAVAILSGEHVVFDGGDLMHVSCSTDGPSPADVVEQTLALLRRSPGNGLCHSCLARGINIGHEEARKITTRLRLTHGVLIKSQRCGGCGQLRVTVGLHDPPPR